MTTGRQRRLTGLALVLVALLVGLTIAWAISVVFKPAKSPVSVQHVQTVKAERGTVENSISLNAQAAWGQGRALLNRLSGTVTSVAVAPGDSVKAGAHVYSVDLHPVFIAQGETPSFRSLSVGLHGPDVLQLKQMLSGEKFYSGTLDENFGSDLLSGVQAWQRSTGQESSGSVVDGTLIFSKSLPARVTFDSVVLFPGASLNGGESVGHVLADAPTFSMVVAQDQLDLIPAGAQVHIQAGKGKVFDARVGASAADADSGGSRLNLESENSGPICGDDCGTVPVTGTTSYTAVVVTTPAVSGVEIPAASIESGSGGAFVITKAGKRISIKVQATAAGMSVVSGLPIGTEVRLNSGLGQ